MYSQQLLHFISFKKFLLLGLKFIAIEQIETDPLIHVFIMFIQQLKTHRDLNF